MVAPRFKDFLSEIDMDDSIYSKEASAAVAKRALGADWSPLPLKTPFWKEGYDIKWRPDPRTQGFGLAVVHADTVMLYIELDRLTVKVPGGTLVGVEVDSLSSHPSARGTGLALRTYEALVESGQVLFSSTEQTSGSRHLWQKLVQSQHVVPFVLAQGAAARWYINRFKAEPSASVLLTGSMSKMVDEAYADNETRWVALPKDLERLDDLRDGAIDLG